METRNRKGPGPPRGWALSSSLKSPASSLQNREGWASATSSPVRKGCTTRQRETEPLKNQRQQVIHDVDSAVTRKATALELAFETKPLRTICETEAQAKLELGNAVAEVLKHRLADLRAATAVSDLVAGKPRILDGSAGQLMVVDLYEGSRLVFKSNHIRRSSAGGGEVNWSRVTRIKILRIDRDHA